MPMQIGRASSEIGVGGSNDAELGSEVRPYHTIVHEEEKSSSGRKTRPIPQPFHALARLETQAIRKTDGQVSGSVTNADHSSTLQRYLQGSQVTDSVTHPSWKNLSKSSFRGDIGGPFFSQRKYVEKVDLSPRTLRAVSDPVGGIHITTTIWRGPMLPLSPNLYVWPSHSFSNADALDEAGATAISRCAPTNPTADVSVMLGELVREGLPTLAMSTLKSWRRLSGRERRRAIAGEYLSLEFAWKPFVSSLRELSSSIVNGDAILGQHARDSGRMVRRRYEFPEKTTVNSVVVQDPASPWASPMSGALTRNDQFSFGRVIRTDTTVRRQWFSGAFSYYFPPSDGSRRTEMARQVIMAKKLLGVTLTPDTVWNLAPWSWAVDWFSNAGDVVNNASNWAIDGQVLLYGYMMEHTIVTRSYTFVGNTGFRDRDVRPADVTLVAETKQRRQATPYGFGVQMEGLSNRQKTIIAALGVARS